MLGSYYKFQLTSVLSITHRLTGVFLSLIGAPVLLWWLAALSGGPEAYQAMSERLSGPPGIVLAFTGLFSLTFHFFNGIRHLFWDTGRLLGIENAYRSGWLVLATTVISTAILLGVVL